MPDMSPQPLTLSAVIRRSPEVLFQEVGGEAVLLDLASETYFGLNAVGARIWALIGEGSSVQSIRDALVAEYDAPEDRIESDLIALTTQLRDAGLVRPD